jgi:hypothetical protein
MGGLAMVDEDPRSKKSKFIEAYLGGREEEHQKAFSQPASTRPVEPTMAYPWSKPLPKHEERPVQPADTTSQRVSIRDLALKRAKPYLRPDQDAQEEPRPSPFARHEQPQDLKYQSLFANKRPGFKLVKETADMKQGPEDPKRKRLCLYDLYAPRIPHDDECRPIEPRERPREEPVHEEAPVKQAHEEEPAPVVMTDQERDEVKEVANSLLWGPKKKTTSPKPVSMDKPILKIGPAKTAPLPEPEPEAEVPPHEEEKAVEEVTPEAEGPKAETAEAKGASGEFCPSCGTKYTDHLVPLICTGCGTVNCTKCNNYEHEHIKTSIYYDYKFDWPLCIACYSKAYNIQKTMAKAMTCFGNGNLTYAVYYAQNAIRMDPKSKYAEDAARLIQRVDDAKVKKDAMDKAWKVQSQKLTRAKFQDPGWQQKKA